MTEMNVPGNFYQEHPSTSDRVLIGARARRERQHIYELALRKFSVGDLPGEDLAVEHIRRKYQRNCKAPTIRSTAEILQSFLGFLRGQGIHDLGGITRGTIAAYVEHEQDRGLQPVSVSGKLKLIYPFLSFLVDHEITHPNVLMRKIRIKLPETLPRAIDTFDMKRILAGINEVRDRAMILLLLRTGMRIGELLNTTIDEVNLKEQKIFIYEGEKNRLGRVVYFGGDASDALAAWLTKRNPTKVFLFYAQGRDTMTYGGVARMMFVKCLREAQLEDKGYTLHCLRHTCATDLLNAGMRLECLQQLLGHSSIEMTRRYARLSDKTREEEYFRAMTIIEKGQNNGYDERYRELPSILEETELFALHR